jgi:hypothetical protein
VNLPEAAEASPPAEGAGNPPAEASRPAAEVVSLPGVVESRSR